jgi:hypothetical protein
MNDLDLVIAGVQKRLQSADVDKRQKLSQLLAALNVQRIIRDVLSSHGKVWR